MGGCGWEIVSRDMDKGEPDAAHAIARALNNRNYTALATRPLEIMRTVESSCNRDPSAMEVPWDRVKAAMLKAFGPVVMDEAYYNAFQLMVTAGGRDSKSCGIFSKGRAISSTNLGG